MRPRRVSLVTKLTMSWIGVSQPASRRTVCAHPCQLKGLDCASFSLSTLVGIVNKVHFCLTAAPCEQLAYLQDVQCESHFSRPIILTRCVCRRRLHKDHTLPLDRPRAAAAAAAPGRWNGLDLHRSPAFVHRKFDKRRRRAPHGSRRVVSAGGEGATLIRAAAPAVRRQQCGASSAAPAVRRQQRYSRAS
jgi:hypothetical protein